MKKITFLFLLLLGFTTLHAQSPLCAPTGTNGQAGTFFEVEASADIELTSIDGDFDAVSCNIELWTRPGSHIGFESSNAGWTLLGTATITGGGIGNPMPLPIAFNIPLTTGNRQAFHLVTTNNTAQNYATGTGTVGVTVVATNAELTQFAGCGAVGLFSGCNFSPRNFMGCVNYSLAGPPSSSVLVMAAATNSWIMDVQAKLNATGRFALVDIFNLTTGTPTVGQLNAYDAVMAFTDGSANDPTATGNALAAYVDGGGGVVDATFTGNIPIGGTYSATYSLYFGSGQTSGTPRTLGTVFTPGSPVMMNVNSFNGGTASYHNTGGTMAAGVVVEAEYDNGQPFVLTKTNVGPANVNRAFLNFYPPSIDARSDFWVPSTDGATLMANALVWVAGAAPIGDPPVISCPADQMIDTTGGQCTGVANWADAIALDTEDGPIPTTQTMGPPSGSMFPVGDTIIEYSATDSDGNTSTCQFTITVTDNEAPIALCQDITVELDAAGNYTMSPNEIDNGSSDNCGIVTYAFGAIVGTNSTSQSPALPIVDNTTVSTTMTVTDNFVITDLNVDLDITHTWVGDLQITLESPAGTQVLIFDGGSDGCSGDNINDLYDDESGNPLVCMTGADAFPLGDYMPSNALSAFDGENTSGDWILFIQDTAGGDSGTLNTWELIYTHGSVFGGTFDCSNVGTNDIVLTVTDAEGNSSSCVSTVTVEDNIAPDIVCIGEPATVVDATSDSPALAILDNTTVSTMMSVTDDFVITDLDVDLDITHTWVGDLQITLESPAGTQVLIFDGSADGCSGDNIVDRYDDESANALACMTGADAFPLADYMPSNPLSAFDGEGTLGDWIIYIEDTAGGDQGTLNSWTLNYSHDVSGSPYDVVLDASGNATVIVSDLIMSITEACGWTATTGGAPVPATLPTTLAGGNGNFGNMFDINALEDVTIDSFDIHGDTGATFDVEVWAKTGTWVGSENTPGDWTLIGTAPGVVSNGDGVVTPLGLSLGYVMNAGETHAFYVTPTDTSTGGFNYTNGTTVGAVFAADANIEFLEGNGNAYPFGTTFQPRIFNGNIQYSAGGGLSMTLDFDCSNLGLNTVDITVTDDSGNVATCTATVNVLDETDPIITCVGPTTPILTGTASDSPGTVIVDNTTVTTTIEVTDDVTMTDLNVDMNITHTWVGDLQITLESPAGTTVLIFDGGADGCSGDNINDIYDDESANALACMAGTGDAFPLADYMPSNALSAFDGESTLGTWTLSVQDTAGGDAGTIDTWGLIYTYEGAPLPAYPIYLDENGEYTVDPYDLIATTDEACGISTAAADITEFFCSDVGTGIILVTVFVSDASGNIASCVAEVEVFDNLPPVVECPADITVDPGPGNLFYEVPDYFASGEATATDNCTDPLTILSQSPAAGTLLPDGVYPVTMTAEDEWGNVGTCTFTLTIESVLGVDENELDVAIIMYPNPAQHQVTISNSSNIQLERATIFDLNGKLISQTNLSTMVGEKTIDVSELAAGVYVVQISSDNASAIKRLIKE